MQQIQDLAALVNGHQPQPLYQPAVLMQQFQPVPDFVNRLEVCYAAFLISYVYTIRLHSKHCWSFS